MRQLLHAGAAAAGPRRGSSPLALIAEIVLVAGLFAAAIWWIIPPRPSLIRWWHVAAGVVIGLVPIALNLARGDGAHHAGFRTDTLRGSVRRTAAATAVMAVVALIVGVLGGGPRPIPPARVVSLCLTYAGWGLAQQYLLQAFMLRRFRLALASETAAVALTACVFAALHAPNWSLVAATGIAAVVWCRLFLRHGNLIPLAVSHGVLAVVLYYAWPWTAGLTVGPGYLARIGQ